MTKKKTGKSRYNYIHYTKKYITIGVKGKKQKKIKHEKVVKEIKKVNKKLKEYSQKYYGKNDDFPRDIGMDTNKNKFTENVINFLGEVQNSGNRIKNIPVDIFNKYQKISNMAKDEKYFEDEFFGEVAKNYGYETLDTETVKSKLESGDFLISVEMQEFQDNLKPRHKTDSDASRLILWLVEHADELNDTNVTYEKGEKNNFDKISEVVKNVNYMRKVVQDFNVFGTVDDYILKIVRGEKLDDSNPKNRHNK